MSYITWEYMEAQIPNDISLHETLNGHGSDGWEMMTLEYQDTNVRCWFKRMTINCEDQCRK
jgi:hypothetical protein